MFKVMGMIFFLVNGEVHTETSTLDYETLENCANMHNQDEFFFDAFFENYLGFSCIKVPLEADA